VARMPFNPFRCCTHGFHIFRTDRLNGEAAAISPYCPTCCPVPPAGYEKQHGDYLRYGYVWQLKVAIADRGHLRDCPDKPLCGEDAWDLALKVRESVIREKQATLTEKAKATSWYRLGLRGHSGSPSLMDTVFRNAIFDLQGMRDGGKLEDIHAYARSTEAANHQVAIHTHMVTPFVEDEDGELESVEEAVERVNYKRPRPYYPLPTPDEFDPEKLRPGVYMTSPVEYSDAAITVPQYARFDWVREKALNARTEEFLKANKATPQLWKQEKDYREEHGQTPAEENLSQWERGKRWPQASFEEYCAEVGVKAKPVPWLCDRIESRDCDAPRASLEGSIRFDRYEGLPLGPAYKKDGKVYHDIIVPTKPLPQFVRPRESGSEASRKHRPRFAWYSGPSMHVDVATKLPQVLIVNENWQGKLCEVRAVSVEATKETYSNPALPLMVREAEAGKRKAKRTKKELVCA
jgi:hypothetical protein